ncbi:MAG TPA: SCO family protein [Nitrosospira sp.]|nr:SCO family protein [Nitrosospira sp.]
MFRVLGEGWRAVVLGAAVMFIAACGNTSTPPSTPAFASTDITGVQFGKGFTLIDHNGVVRSLSDFRGKAVALFFGYTHCPDKCPATMAQVAAALEKLGPAAGRVQVLFVTLDPERDTPSVLKQYLSGFNPRFLGLYGDDETTQETASQFKVFSQRQGAESSGDHTVDHSTGVYIFDPQGQLRLYANAISDGGDALARDLAQLLKAAA